MELTQEQIQEFKEQIIRQIETSFPEDKKGYAIERIKSMDDEEFLEFLKNNNLQASESTSKEKSQEKTESPFRLIIEGKIPSYKIDENKICIAVLEINPISKAHIIIIPKKPITKPDKLPKAISSLAKKVSERIKNKFNPKEVLISPSYVLGETIINLLPVYSNESLSSPRKQASKEELEIIKDALEKKSKTKIQKTPRIKKIQEEKLWLPRRIP
jgi:histidine triad (HIT) family protein